MNIIRRLKKSWFKDLPDKKLRELILIGSFFV